MLSLRTDRFRLATADTDCCNRVPSLYESGSAVAVICCLAITAPILRSNLRDHCVRNAADSVCGRWGATSARLNKPGVNTCPLYEGHVEKAAIAPLKLRGPPKMQSALHFRAASTRMRRESPSLIATETFSPMARNSSAAHSTCMSWARNPHPPTSSSMISTRRC